MIIFPDGIVINDVDFIALEDSLISVQDWLSELLQNKIANSRNRMRKEWVDILIDDPNFNDPLPSIEDQLLVLIRNRPNYKPRRDRPDIRPER